MNLGGVAMRMRVVRWAGVVACAIAAAGCQDRYKGGGELHAQKVVLQREVEGLRAIVSRLERHEPMLPAGDVVVAIDESLLQNIIAAQLPLDADVDRYHLRLSGVDVTFRGSPIVRLKGALHPLEQPGLEAEVDVVGVLEHIEIVPGESTLKARIAIDHLTVEKAAGLESVLSGSTLDEIAVRIRDVLKDQIPLVQIPVKVQEDISLPAVTRGPVRVDGAVLPLGAGVSQVVAVRGRLWIAVHFDPGTVRKTADAPDVDEASTPSSGVAVPPNDTSAKPPARTAATQAK
jgi:hypothetical protein